ncbi:hypothetical protein N7540_006757 [Penicillium herquei]|nr:hypothetical protein N7540_006757 [Penicillium herquei]
MLLNGLKIPALLNTRQTRLARPLRRQYGLHQSDFVTGLKYPGALPDHSCGCTITITALEAMSHQDKHKCRCSSMQEATPLRSGHRQAPRWEHHLPMLPPPHTAIISGKQRQYTSDENALLVRLKEKEAISWSEITTHFPSRNMSSLQVHYSTKLRPKASSRS